MAIRDVLQAARALQEAWDQLDALQARKQTLANEREAVQVDIDGLQVVVDAAKTALKAAAATL